VPKYVRDYIAVLAQSHLKFSFVPSGAKLGLIDIRKWAGLTTILGFNRCQCTPCKWDGTASSRLGDPESCPSIHDVPPTETNSFANPGPSIDQKNTKVLVMLRLIGYRRKQPCLFIGFQEAYPTRSLLLPTEFRETVDLTHLARLSQQFAQRCHLSIDGRVAIAAFA